MNKVYKVVWNASLGAWVAVSELAKTKTKNRGNVGQVVSLDLEEHQDNLIKFFNYKALSLAILTILTPALTFAGYTAGGGQDNQGTGVAIGNGSNGSAQVGSNGAEAIAIGATTRANGSQSTVVGNDITANGDQSVVIGSNFNSNMTTSTGKGGVAIGSGLYSVGATKLSSPMANGLGSLALGSSGDNTTGTDGFAYNKNGAVATATYSAALMMGASTQGDRSIAFGVNAQTGASAVDGVALGTGANASVANSVALGGGSTTTAPSGTGYITNSAAPTSVVSVGSASNLRRIQNVADGAADQDAVTVAQLKDVNNRAVGNTTALGGGATYNAATDTYTAPSYTINKADAGSYAAATNVGTALSNLNTEIQREITFVGNTGTVGRNLGETLNITGGLAGASSNSNVKTVITGNTLDIQIANSPNFSGTVTSTGQQVNGNSTVTGNSIVNGTSTIGGGANAVTLSGTANGLDVGGKKITNVAAPTVGSDAANKTYVDTLANTPLGFVGDSGTKATRKLGEDLNVKGGATGTLTNGNIGVVSNGSNQLDIKLAETVNLGANGSVTTGNSKVDNSGLTITGGPSVTNAGINAANKNISNVADATTADQAVNKGQLDTVSTQANKAITFTGNARKSGDTKDVDRKLGETIAISGAASTAGSYSGANVKTVTDQTGSIAIQIADAPNFAGTVTSTGQQVNGNSVVTGTSTIGSGANAVTLSGTANGLDVGGKKITNVAAPTVGSDATNKTYVDGKVQNLADTPLGFVGDSGTKATRKLGEDLNVKGGATGTLTNGNIGVVSNGSNQLDIKLAETVNLGSNGSVTTGNTKIDNSGLTITGGPSVTNAGINAGSKVISNVAAGSAATDAVNKGQLDTVSTQANKAITFTGNARKSGDTTDVDRKLGESIAISGAASTAGSYSGANVKTVTDQTGSIAIQIADAPNFAGTVTSTGQQVNGNSVVTGTSTIGSGANAVTLSGTANGLDVGGKKITNVAAPTVGSDATNKTYVDGKVQTLADTPLGFVGDSGTKATRKLGEDLNVKGGATGTLTNGNIGVVSNGSNQLDIKLAETVNLGSNGSVTTGNTKIDNSGLTITGGPSVTSTGINAGSKVISNVAAGSAATDAVNKGQLDAATTAADTKTDALGNSTASNLGGGSTYNSTTGT
ncbi:ESPR-type extended signal peptide-containing protein, partial [Acinetobacter proteolyticus]|uniref:ESPR-type extended signal peptide-containing protein n=1 Tax=Acinetobacter proteolyticus TaxID=1776741 RepID=UPI00226AF48F